MAEIIFEFQNTEVPERFNEEVGELKGDGSIVIKSRKSKSVSGVETLIISVAGRIVGEYVLKLIKYLEEKVKAKVLVKLRDEGKEYKLPEEKSELLDEISKDRSTKTN
jgi:hypothetical protein